MPRVAEPRRKQRIPSGGAGPRRLVRLLALATALACAAAACGPGFDGYRSLYATPDAGPPGEPWTGPEWVAVSLDGETSDVPLAGLPTVALDDAQAVPLQQVVSAAGLLAAPDRWRYNLVAADGYDLLGKRGTAELLPSWSELAAGVLYRHPQGDLRVGWDPARQPWGAAVSAYRVKWMDGGRIEGLSGQ